MANDRGAGGLTKQSVAKEEAWRTDATVAQRLLSAEPLAKGGWSLNANYAPGYATMSPAAHSFLRGLGKQSLFGWPLMPKVEELRSEWIDAR